MGFNPPRTVYKLRFEGSDLEGLEVRARACTIREMTNLVGEDGKRDDATMSELFDLFVTHLESWNIEDDGQPVPTTRDGLESLELSLVTTILSAWQKAMVDVPGPLQNGSSGGETTLEASLDLESLSQSLPNSPEPS